VLVVVAFALAIAACGSSTHSSGAGITSSFPQEVRYADCMRSHGVSNFPDPSPGGGFNVRALGAEAQAPAFVSAQSACAKLQPGGPAPLRISGEQLYQMAAKARCIRQHGFSNLPEPTLVDGGAGTTNPPTGWNPEAPAAVKARKACAHVGIAVPGWGLAWFGPVA
jgi:hypothetical protein